MEKSTLNPFLRENLEILFVGLNPARGSSENRHYFSVNQAFWNQLKEAGLLTESINKDWADLTVFSDNTINYNGWWYGITDIVSEVAESNSRTVKVELEHCKKLTELICLYKPKTVILIHQKLIKSFLKYHNHSPQKANYGCLGNVILSCDSMFFSIGFPHGNSISSSEKIAKYIEVREYIDNLKDNL